MSLGNFVFTPPFDNIVFYDGEFTSLDPYAGELLSVGMVKPNGEEIYLEIEPKGVLSDWDKEHVVPYLEGNYISRTEAKARITEFLGQSQPHMVCFVPQYDMIFLHKLFGSGDSNQDNLPYHWMPVDFASILFALGVHPRKYSDDNPELFSRLGIDPKAYRQHNALDDAKMLKRAYESLAKQGEGTAHRG